MCLAVAFAALGVGGCGDDDRPTRTATAFGGAVRVAGDEYSFDPDVVIARPGRLRLTLVNEGTLAHNLKVFDGDREVGGTTTFQGGQTRAADLDLEAGDYRMVCTVGDHEDLGMTGSLRVE